MPVVKINAIEVPPDAGPELEKRFAHRAHAVDNQPGFLGFQLLRPVKGEDRYFVVTQWESEEAFQAWATGRRELYALTRFGATNQVHRVAMPLGARTQITFEPERVLDLIRASKEGQPDREYTQQPTYLASTMVRA